MATKPIASSGEMYSGLGSRPIPDPTVLTSALVDQAVGALRDLMNAKFESVGALNDQRYNSLVRVVQEHSDLDLRTLQDTRLTIEKHVADKVTALKSEFEARAEAHEKQDVVVHEGQKELINSRFESTIQLRQAMQVSMKEAVDKAERATDARFEDSKRSLDKLSEAVRANVPMSVFTEAQKAEQAYRDGVNDRIAALETAVARTSGKDTGIGISWGAIVGGAGILIAIFTALTFINNRQGVATATPQSPTVYIPAQPGTLIPSAPAQNAPR